MTSEQALAFIREHGVVLEAANGPIPSLLEAIVGSPLRGNWWSHPRSKEIFQITRAVRASEEILVCRLVSGKVTFVHRRLWPALVRCAALFRPASLVQIREEHTDSGRHAVNSIAFPTWVPDFVFAEAHQLSERVALDMLSASIPDLPGQAS